MFISIAGFVQHSNWYAAWRHDPPGITASMLCSRLLHMCWYWSWWHASAAGALQQASAHVLLVPLLLLLLPVCFCIRMHMCHAYGKTSVMQLALYVNALQQVSAHVLLLLLHVCFCSRMHMCRAYGKTSVMQLGGPSEPTHPSQHQPPPWCWHGECTSSPSGVADASPRWQARLRYTMCLGMYAYRATHIDHVCVHASRI